jgi:hypothetical protein
VIRGSVCFATGHHCGVAETRSGHDTGQDFCGCALDPPDREINTVDCVATITLSLPLAIRKTLLEQGMDTTCVRVRDH